MEPFSSKNAGALLRELWQYRELSRADLARRVGLSRSTVTQLIPDLLELGVVYESHVGRSRGGRPPVMLRFRDDFAHVVGIDLGSSHLTVVLTDLRGKVLCRRREVLDVTGEPQRTLALMRSLIRTVLSDVSVPRPLLGIGLAVPCAVESTRHGELSPRILPAWSGIRPAEELAEEFGAPVAMENDANLGALAELFWGCGAERGDFAFIKLATGIGSGLIVDGRIYRGAEGIAGEIGHTAILVNGPPCRCGLRGCLEALVGSYAIEGRVRHRVSQRTRETSLSGDEHLTDIVRAARAGDLLAAEVIREAGEQLGIALANLLNLMNPSRLVLSGRLTEAGELLLLPIRQTIAGRAMHGNVMSADIVISELDSPIGRGAAAMVLQDALASPTRFTSCLSGPSLRRSPVQPELTT